MMLRIVAAFRRACQAVSCRFLAFVVTALVLGVGGGGRADAAPDQVVFGPVVIVRTTGAPQTETSQFALPPDVSAPYLLRIESGRPDGTRRVASASVSVNGVQVVGQNDFNPQVSLVERTVALVPQNVVSIQIAGRPDGQLTVTILGSAPRPVPVSLSPNPLAVSAGAVGQLTVQLAPVPRQGGTVAFSTDNALIASVPASIAYDAGQGAVPVPVTGVAPGTAVLTATANGGSATGSIQVGPAAPGIASLLPSTLSVTQGSRSNLRVSLSAAQSADVRVDLSTTDGTVVAVPPGITVPAGQSGVDFQVSAMSPGSAQISARLNGTVASTQVTVTPGVPTLVSLLPASSTASIGASATLQLSLSSAPIVPTDVLVRTEPAGLLEAPAAIVVPAGQTTVPITLTTLALGTAGVTAMLNESRASAAVHVVPPAPAVAALQPESLAIIQDATGSLTVRLNAQQLENTEILLAAGTADIVTIPPSVVVPAGQLSAQVALVGRTVGTTTVTARIGESSRSAQIAVVPYPPKPVSLLPESLPLQQGASGVLTLTINAAQLTDTVIAVGNSAPTVLQVPSQVVVPAGQLTASLPVTALAEGGATLTISLNDATVQAAVTVTPPPPQANALTPASLSLPKGVPGVLRVALTRAPLAPSVVALASSDPLIVSVSPSVTVPAGALHADFAVVARAEGVATVSAALNGVAVVSEITVTAPALTALTLSPQLPTAFIGEAIAFRLDATYTDATTNDATSRATWTSSAPDLLGVATTGVATARGIGRVTVTATLESLTAATDVIVEAVPLLGLQTAATSLKVGSPTTITVTSSAPAEAGGLAVSLTVSGIGTITAPSFVVIAEGQRQASFTVVGASPGQVNVVASAPRRVLASVALQVVPNVSITELRPASGPVGIPVTIIGENFDPDPAKNEVRFNGERAVVGNASASALQVIVPVRATSGTVTVTTPAGVVSSPAPFTVQLQQDFDLTLLPESVQASPGGRVFVRVRLTSVGLLPYANAATLQVSGVPAGIGAVFERSAVSLNNESSLQLSVPAGIPAGRYAISIQAAGATEIGQVSRGKTVVLDVMPAGATTVTGRVLNAADDRPFSGARIRLGGQETLTDASGFYRFDAPTVLGDQVVLIDGHTANTDTVRYASAIAMPVTIVAGKDNPVLTSYLSAVDATKSFAVTPGAQTAVTMPDLPEYSLNIPAGAILYGWDGTPVTEINVRTIPPDRLPIKPVPAGVETRSVYLYYFFREGGANPTQPIPVTMINDTDAAPGDKVTLWYYDESINPDPTSNQWRVMGLGTVSADGKRIVSDPGVGIPKFCCGATFAQNRPDPEPRGPEGGDGDEDPDEEEDEDDSPPIACPEQPVSQDPVDLASGANLATRGQPSFGIKSAMSARLGCRYRSGNTRIGSFGRGMSFSYDRTATVSAGSVRVTTSKGVTYSMARAADGGLSASGGRLKAQRWSGRTTATGATVRYARGREMDFDTAGRLNTIRDKHGNAVRIARDNRGFVTGIVDGVGRGYSFQSTTRTVGGQIYTLVSKIVDSIGRTRSFEYDLQARLIAETDAMGNVTRYEYDAAGRISRKIDAAGGALQFAYDAAGRTTREILQDGVSEVRYEYDTVGNLVSGTRIIDALGRTTEYRFNGQGYVTRKTDAASRVFEYQRDFATNRVVSARDPAGRTTLYAYDSRGNVTEVTDPIGNVTRIEYDPTWNKPTKVTDALGNISQFRYDERGRLVESIDPMGARRQAAYTRQGKPSEVVDPLDRRVLMTYDVEGNLTELQNPLGQKTRFRYDAANRLVESIDPLGYSATRTYDALDRLTEATDPQGGTVKLSYDAVGRFTGLVDPRTNAVERRVLDARGRVILRLDAAGLGDSYEYDRADNLKRTVDRKGQALTIAYDVLDRPIEVQDADGRITRAEYDLAGNLSALRDNRSGDLLFSHDALGRTTRVVSDLGTVEYAYDALGRRTQRTLNGGDPTDYRYDAASRLIEIAYRGRQTTYAYDPAGRLSAKTLPNGIKQAYVFDAADRILEVRHERADGSLLERVGYAYDAAGRRTRREAALAGVAETPIEASYDASNRLATLNIAGSSYTVAYDENGNLKTKTAADGAVTTYTWDARNRLTDIAGPGLSARFRYDALGRRIEKTVNGDTVQYLYDGPQALAEIRGGAVSATLLNGLAIDEAIARYTNAGERTLLTDALGSVLIAARDDGTVEAAYGYSPYGETQVLGNDAESPTQYTARENDGTGLFYYRARYYDPVLKRFMSEDPIGLAGGVNVYTYVGGDPVSITDPRGLDNPGMGPYDGPSGRGSCGGHPGIGDVDENGCVDAGVLKICLGPGALRAVGARLVTGAAKVFSKEKQALVDMAKADKKTGMTAADMQAYKDLNKQLPDPFPTNKVRGPEAHMSGAPSSQAPHGHVGPVDHIPIR